MGATGVRRWSRWRGREGRDKVNLDCRTGLRAGKDRVEDLQESQEVEVSLESLLRRAPNVDAPRSTQHSTCVRPP